MVIHHFSTGTQIVLGLLTRSVDKKGIYPHGNPPFLNMDTNWVKINNPPCKKEDISPL